MAWHLFWLGRYAQRAALCARVVEAAVGAALLPESAGGGAQPWQDALSVCGAQADFAVRFGAGSPELIAAHLLGDVTNASSLTAAMAQARENARIARGHLSPAAWESINAGHHEAQAMPAAPMSPAELARACERASARIHHFVGTLHGTLLHDDAWQFCCVGLELERALGTARVLRLGARSGERPSRWEAVLAYLGAETAYRSAYGAAIDGARVCELLVEHQRLSASLRHCAEAIARRLGAIAGPSEARSAAAALAFAGRCGGGGLRSLAWVDGAIDDWHVLSDLIHHDYLVAPCASPSIT
jgi:uncharacterized alpha-E superfamily protein